MTYMDAKECGCYVDVGFWKDTGLLRSVELVYCHKHKHVNELHAALNLVAQNAEYARTGCNDSSEFMTALEDIVNITEDVLDTYTIEPI